MQKKWLIAIPLILFLLVLCAAMVFVSIFSFNRARVAGISLPGIGSRNIAVEESDERTFNVSGPAKLAVNNFAGQIRVEKGTTGKIVVETTKEALGYSEQDAKNNLENVTINMTQDGDALDIRVTMKQSVVNWVGKVDFVIRVPEKTEVKIDSSNGDLILSGTDGAADLNTDFGSIQVKEVKGGSLTVKTKNGHVEVSGAQSGSSDIMLRSNFGDVDLSDASGKSVTIASQNGTLTLKDVNASGKVELTSDFGRIAFEEGRASSLEVKTQNGEVTLSKVKVGGKLIVNSDFGTVRVNGCEAQDYDLKTLNGGMSLDGASGKIKAHTDFGEVEVKNASSAALDLKSKNGAVRFEGSLGSGPHTLSSDFGNVVLRLPSNTALNIDLKTEFGEISSDFEVTMSGKVEKDHWTGKVNGGGDLLTVTTKNGNITLENAR